MTPTKEQLMAWHSALDLLLAEIEGQGGTYGATRDAAREALRQMRAAADESPAPRTA